MSPTPSSSQSKPDDKTAVAALLPDAMNVTEKPGKSKRQLFRFVGVALFLVAVVMVVSQIQIGQSTVFNFLAQNITQEFFLYMLGGFIAQMVDGALGMAYGLTSTTFLLSVGISPAAASASVHASEVFTSGASGLMHLKLKNVNRKLFTSLLIPGVMGAALGAYIL